MVKVILMVLGIFIVPGVVLGLISSYRAGQKPHRELYLMIKKFTRRKNK